MLPPRQIQVINLIAQGHTIQEIGRILGIAKDTAHSYRRRAFEALGARNATHAVAIAYWEGLLDEEALGASSERRPSPASDRSLE